MKRCCAWVAVLGCALISTAAAADNGSKQVGQCMNLVKEAGTLIEEQGDEAFDTFRVRGGDFFNGDTYIFVKNLDGTILVHPVDRNLEGKSDLEFKDVDGRKFGELTLESAKGNDAQGWSHYRYHKPGSTEPVWKSTFCVRVTAPNGIEYVVGSGIYNAGPQMQFINDTLNKAAVLVETNGPAVFDTLRNRTGLFFYGDTYVFVLNNDGVELVNPAFPKMEGRNLWDLTDANGDFPVKMMFERLEKANSGNQVLFWPKPGETEPSRKEVFFRRIEFNGEKFVIGTGRYTN